MRKISYYLLLMVAMGGFLASFWVYQKYFKIAEPKILQFKVERGNLQEAVRVRGEVVAEKDFDLEFPFSGTVEKVFVSEGQQVNQGFPLIKLETIDFDLEVRRLNAVLGQRQANLTKLLTGATSEDIDISKTKVENAKTALTNARKNLLDKLNDAYTKADDAVRNQTDQFFSNPRSANPSLNLISITGQLRTDLESERVSLELLLNAWKSLSDSLSAADDKLNLSIATFKSNLGRVGSFLDKAALAVNGLTPGSDLTQAIIDTYKSAVSTARTNINTAISNLSAAEEKLKIAESNLLLAQNELAFKEAGTRNEDIEIAKAQIDEVKSQIASLEEKIKKSTIYAPGQARVTKTWFEVGEVFRPGQTVISLSTFGHKIQADVSELEIGKIKDNDGNPVSIRLDAFPGQALMGKIISVEPREVIKEGDRYYKINVYMDPHGSEIRSGMNVDLIIDASSKENILKVPEFVVYGRDDKKFVKVLDGGIQLEKEIKTGISDGESVEIVSGLSEGQTVMVSAD